MKTIMFFLTMLAIGLTTTMCTDETSDYSQNQSVTGNYAIVELTATQEPYLKDGGEDEDPIPTYTISGFVLDEAGNPVDATVSLINVLHGNTQVGETLTSSEGSFAFSQIPPGNYNVVVLQDGEVIESLSITL